VLWKHAHGWWPPGSAAYDAARELVFAACNDESLVAARAGDGTIAWTARTEGLVRGRPVQCGSALIVATERGRLQCFDAASGDVVWTRRYGEGLAHQFLQVTADKVMVMDGKWHLSGFDLGTGELRWLNRLRSPGCWRPVAYGKYLVVLSRKGHLAVLDPEQEVKVWEGQIPGAYHQAPALAQGTLVAASSNSGLLCFDIHPDYAC
jgi:outer membrane protein assembly factor BamB